MKNYFQIFNIPETFFINENNLEQKYFTLQNSFHPDKSTIADIEKSISINEAYEILTNPLLRAIHLLQLKNYDILAEQNGVKPDMTTLEEILELRQEIAHLAVEKIPDVKKNLRQKIKTALEEFAQLMQNNDHAKAAQILIRARYYQKTLDDLKNA